MSPYYIKAYGRFKVMQGKTPTLDQKQTHITPVCVGLSQFYFISNSLEMKLRSWLLLQLNQERSESRIFKDFVQRTYFYIVTSAKQMPDISEDSKVVKR